MGLNPGDHINYRIIPELCRYSATVLSLDEDSLVLRLGADAPASVGMGSYVMISEQETDVEHYNEVSGWDGRTLQLRRMWTGKRGFFRVDDVFPVLYRKIDPETLPLESRLIAGYGSAPDEFEVPDASVSPRLWKMLADINAKLSLVLERMNLEGEGLARAESIPVNISASGIRFTLPMAVDIGDIIELKMLLPVYPQVGVLAHGAVVRVEELDNGNFGASFRFINLTEEVRDTIIQYALRRQREIIRRQRRLEQDE